jgi:hypothetical protein
MEEQQKHQAENMMPDECAGATGPPSEHAPQSPAAPGAAMSLVPDGQYEAIIRKIVSNNGQIEWTLQIANPDLLHVKLTKIIKTNIELEEAARICNINRSTANNKFNPSDFAGIGLDITISGFDTGSPEIEFIRRININFYSIATEILKRHPIPQETLKLIRHSGIPWASRMEYEYAAILSLGGQGLSYFEIEMIFRAFSIGQEYQKMGEEKAADYLAILYGNVTGNFNARFELISSQSGSSKYMCHIERGKHCKWFLRELIPSNLTSRKDPVNYPFIGSTLCSFFEYDNGKFFLDNNENLWMTYQGEEYEINARSNNRSFHSMFFEETGLLISTSSGKQVFDAFANTAFQRAKKIMRRPWASCDTASFSCNINLHDADSNILHVNPYGVHVLKNISNKHNLILGYSDDVLPLEYLPDLSIADGMSIVNECIISKLTCPPYDAKVYFLWAIAAFLKNFVSTAPLLHSSGAKGSGKTTAAKIMTTSIFGDIRQVKATVAALYSEAATHPAVFPDNLELENIDRQIIDFLTHSATGGLRIKRMAGSANRNHASGMQCFINFNGIESPAGKKTELTSRIIDIQFDEKYKSDKTFIAHDVLDTIREIRPIFFTTMVNKIQLALRLMQSGALKVVVRMIEKAVGSHPKDRLFEALALMYILDIADDSIDEQHLWNKLHDLPIDFINFIKTQKERYEEEAQASNPTVNGLYRLYYAYNFALIADGGNEHGSNVANFAKSYNISFSGKNTIHAVTAESLHHALKKASSMYDYKDPHQLSKRIENDLDSIERRGYKLSKQRGAQGYNRYTIVLAQEILDEMLEQIHMMVQSQESIADEEEDWFF